MKYSAGSCFGPHLRVYYVLSSAVKQWPWPGSKKGRGYWVQIQAVETLISFLTHGKLEQNTLSVNRTCYRFQMREYGWCKLRAEKRERHGFFDERSTYVHVDVDFHLKTLDREHSFFCMNIPEISLEHTLQLFPLWKINFSSCMNQTQVFQWLAWYI